MPDYIPPARPRLRMLQVQVPPDDGTPRAPSLNAMTPDPDLADLLEQSAELEREAIRVALDRTGGLVIPAARLLGWTEGRLRRALVAHPDLGDLSMQLRENKGYHGGNPTFYGRDKGARPVANEDSPPDSAGSSRG